MCNKDIKRNKQGLDRIFGFGKIRTLTPPALIL